MARSHRQRHIDGTRCKEGTRRVPPRFRACCAAFAGHLATCDYDLRYEWWQRQRFWVITIAEAAGGGGVVIRYCPHCGLELKPLRRWRLEGRPGRGQPGRWIPPRTR
jgi:hypothetical protein